MKPEPSKQAVELAVSNYLGAKKSKLTSKNSDAIVGFIKKNKIVGKTPEEIDALVSTAEKLSGGELIGEGDKFRRWCEKLGRSIPSDDLVAFLNRDPFEAGQHVKQNVGNDPAAWRNWVSYRSGKGRNSV